MRFIVLMFLLSAILGCAGEPAPRSQDLGLGGPSPGTGPGGSSAGGPGPGGGGPEADGGGGGEDGGGGVPKVVVTVAPDAPREGDVVEVTVEVSCPPDHDGALVIETMGIAADTAGMIGDPLMADSVTEDAAAGTITLKRHWVRERMHMAEARSPRPSYLDGATQTDLVPFEVLLWPGQKHAVSRFTLAVPEQGGPAGEADVQGWARCHDLPRDVAERSLFIRRTEIDPAPGPIFTGMGDEPGGGPANDVVDVRYERLKVGEAAPGGGIVRSEPLREPRRGIKRGSETAKVRIAPQAVPLAEARGVAGLDGQERSAVWLEPARLWIFGHAERSVAVGETWKAAPLPRDYTGFARGLALQGETTFDVRTSWSEHPAETTPGPEGALATFLGKCSPGRAKAGMVYRVPVSRFLELVAAADAAGHVFEPGGELVKR